METNASSATGEEVLRAFTTSLDHLGVSWTRCVQSDLSDALTKVVEAPVVGAPLPFAEINLLAEINLEDNAEREISWDPTADQLREARTGVTAGFLGVADHGSVVIQHQAGAEVVSLFPERHVAVLRASDVVPDLSSALAQLAETIRAEHTSFVLATGPSATADMGSLVKGAHGPREVHVVILEEK